LAGERLVVRRTRLTGPQATLWPDWRHHAFVTDRAGDAVELDTDHRRHAVCELAIRDLKDGVGLRHCPSGVFLANAAWAVIATLAHNLLRWVATIGWAAAGQWSPRPCAVGCWSCPGGSPAQPDGAGCTYPPAGHGPHSSSTPWSASARSQHPAESASDIG
jgi:hypothetical protein